MNNLFRLPRTNDNEEEEENREIVFVELTLKCLLFATFVCLGAFKYLPSATLLDLSVRVHSGDQIFTSLVFSTRSVGYIVGYVLGGIAYQSLLGTHHTSMVLCFLTFLLAGLVFFITLCKTLINVLVFFFFVGIWMAGIDIGVTAFYLHCGLNRKGTFIPCLYVFHGLGATLAPAYVRGFSEIDFNDTMQIISQVGKGQSDAAMTHSYTFFSCLTFVVSSLWLLFYFCNTSNEAAPRFGETERKEEIVRHVYRHLTVLNASILAFVSGCIDSGYVHLLPFTCCTFTFQMSEEQSMEVMIVFLGFHTLGRLLTRWSTPKYSADAMLIFGAFLLLCASTALTMYPAISKTNFWVSNAMMGLGTGPIFPSLLNWLHEKFHVTHKTFLPVFILYSVSEMIMPHLLNRLLLKYPLSIRPFMFIVTLTFSASLVLEHFLMKQIYRKRRITPEQTSHPDLPGSSQDQVDVEEESSESPPSSPEQEDSRKLSSSSVCEDLKLLRDRINLDNVGVTSSLERTQLSRVQMVSIVVKSKTPRL